MIFGSRLIPLCAIWFLAIIRHLPHSWYESEHNIVAAHEIGMLPISPLHMCADVKTLLPAGICLVECRSKGLLEVSMGLPGRLPVARGHEGERLHAGNAYLCRFSLGTLYQKGLDFKCS